MGSRRTCHTFNIKVASASAVAIIISFLKRVNTSLGPWDQIVVAGWGLLKSILNSYYQRYHYV